MFHPAEIDHVTPGPAGPRAILVLGMHRSGTSALTRVLNLLGVPLGEGLLDASADNTAGFWEHREIVLLHDRLLERIGSRWDDPRPLPEEALLSKETRPFRNQLRTVCERDFGGKTLWGLKDPRLCRLVPLWRSLLAEMGCTPLFVLTARRAADVAASLRRRDGFPEELSHLLWLEHCLAAERDTRGAARSFATYDDLLADWRKTALRIGRDLGCDWSADCARAAADVDAFLDPSLCHHQGGAAQPVAEHAWLRGTYVAWEAAGTGADPGPALSAIRDRLDSAGRLFFPWADRLEAEGDRVRGQVRERDATLARLRAGSEGHPARATAEKARPRPFTRRPGTEIRRTYERPEGSPRVSIVIPLFNRCELTAKCLESIAEHTPDGLYEVILVDNASSDATGDLLECLEGNVKVVVNEKNLGFSVACNQGAEMASTENLLFLNNDIEVKPGWLEAMLGVIDADPAVAAVGSRLLFPDGTLQHAGVALLHSEGAPTPLRAFHVHYGQPGDFPEALTASEFQVLTGACLMVRRGVFEQVGGFDTYFWNGCEDVDLCLKIGAAGWTLVYEPKSCLVHHESQSGAERYSRVTGNEELLSSRWLGKVEADIREDAQGNRARTGAQRIRPWKRAASTAAERPVSRGAGDAIASVVVLTRNQLPHTQICFESLKKHTPEPHEVIFVDNGSTDGTLEWLRDVAREHTFVRVIAKAENTGFAGGNNHGLALARGRHVVLLNNDTAVTEGWLGGLMAALDERSDVGLVGPVTNHASGPQRIAEAQYTSLPEMECFAREWAAAHSGETEDARRLVGFCLLARREVVDEIGGLDERFGTGNCEDDDWCVRAHQAGWRGVIARGVFVHHTGGRTFAGERIDYAGSILENFELFKEKWGMDASARAEHGYPFVQLAEGPRQPKIDLPALDTHRARMGGRWLADRGVEQKHTAHSG